LANRRKEALVDGYFWVLLFGGLVAYIIPWLVNHGVGITPNAYDLAEWVSLHPASHISTPPLFTSLLQRLPPVCLAFVLAFFDVRGRLKRRATLACVIVIAVALLPPLEFFTSTRGDANYQQQLILSLVALLGGVLGVSGVIRKADAVLVAVSSLAGALACTVGLAQGYELMLQFDLSAQIGLGGLALTVIFLAIALKEYRRFRSEIA
jgi:hypothetical protein